MNVFHRIVCGSSFWKRVLERTIFPWVFEGVNLGDDVVEIGPGPGLTTDLLRRRVQRLTAVEVDHGLAARLARRMAGTNVTVLERDAAAMPFADASFDGAVCLTMLHHVPSPQRQDRLLGEVARVLRPGAVFAGCDTVSSASFNLAHLFDTCVPVDAATFPARLAAAGFDDVRVEANRRAFRFSAHKPARAAHDEST